MRVALHYKLLTIYIVDTVDMVNTDYTRTLKRYWNGLVQNEPDVGLGDGWSGSYPLDCYDY